MIERYIAVRGNNLHVKVQGHDLLPALVFLHGFTGSSETWNEVTNLLKGKFKMITIDLTGHGKSMSPEKYERYSMKEQIEDLEVLFQNLALQKFTLVGYSMGGRIALAYSVKYPQRLNSLVLESASPGLKTKAEQDQRKEADQNLANKIKSEGLDSFVSFWEEIPLFASQKLMTPEKKLTVKKERLSQSVNGLSNSLIGVGTGSQPSLWKKLKSIELPVLLLTGEFDKKFVYIAREMEGFLPFVRHETIKDVGHAIHVENPTTFATMIEEHVTELKN